MARRTKVVRIETEGRDRGKQFLITEMSAARAEDWAARLLITLARSEDGKKFLMTLGQSGLDWSGVEQLGLAGVAYVGIGAIGGIYWAEARELMGELMSCVSVMPDSRKSDFTRALVDSGGDGDDIEEVATRARLKMEALELHTGFSIAGYVSKLRASLTRPASAGPTTEMSPGQSPPSSVAA